MGREAKKSHLKESDISEGVSSHWREEMEEGHSKWSKDKVRQSEKILLYLTPPAEAVH